MVPAILIEMSANSGTEVDKAAKPLYFSVLAVAKVLGVSPSTVRCWENIGLVTPRRSPSGYRQFTAQQVEHLKKAQQIRISKGLTSRAVVHLLDRDAEPAVEGGGGRTPVAALLRKLRERRGLALAEVAQETSISLSFLGGIESGRINASVATLQKLAQIYGTNVLSLFGGQETAQKLIRPAERRSLQMGSGVVMESLAASQSVMEPHLFRVAPGASSGGGYTHDGEEFLYLLEGTFEIWLDEEEHYRMKAGDSLYFSSRQAHRWANSGAAEAVVLWLNTPATF